jgi:serine/threonine-protein kinase
MELLEGRTLRELLARESPLDFARAVSIILQTCDAVGAAHDAGLIHRDLKPANIFIEQRSNSPADSKGPGFWRREVSPSKSRTTMTIKR